MELCLMVSIDSKGIWTWIRKRRPSGGGDRFQPGSGKQIDKGWFPAEEGWKT